MIITITGGKGGTGKSTVATSLAYFSRNSLLVDADVDCPNDHIFLSIKLKKDRQIYQLVPKFDKSKCKKCGKCSSSCNRDAIVSLKGKYPVLVKELCDGCGACLHICPYNAILKSKKVIGYIYKGRNYGVNLVSGELKIGEYASGKVVDELKNYAFEYARKIKSKNIFIDSASGIGCPVISSISSSDFVIATTEPTPSALHDLKRVLKIINHFKIKCGAVINKFNLNQNYTNKIINFLKENNVPLLGKIPYDKQFLYHLINQTPYTKYESLFNQILEALAEI